MIRILALLLFSLTLCPSGSTAQEPSLTVGVLKFGTVNWELQTIKANKLDHKAGFNLEILPLASKQASTTALHANAVDAIVNDWIWVSRQRSEGRKYSFIPYSRMVGALMVRPGISSLNDLKGQKLGIAGGPVDKSWLLFQAYGNKTQNLNLKDHVDPVFAAPPLLSKKLEDGELAGVITFWHYSAKLEAAGFKRLLDVGDALKGLGLTIDTPMIGYVFTPEMTHKRPELIQAFHKASRQAKQILVNSAVAWETLRPLMKAKDDQTFQALKSGFVQGIVQTWGKDEQQGAHDLFAILTKWGGSKLVGSATQLNEGTFVPNIHY